MANIYEILKSMYSGYSAKQLGCELNRIQFLNEYTIDGKHYKKAEVVTAFKKLIREIAK